jgi:hypothetical protein
MTKRRELLPTAHMLVKTGAFEVPTTHTRLQAQF